MRRFLLCLAVIIPATTLVAQVTGGITGRVQASDGSALPGVTITISAATIESARTTTTDQNGDFDVTGLPPGTYQVTADLPGMQTVSKTTTVVLTGASTLTITLSPTPIENITVTAGPVEIEAPFTTVRVYYGTNRTRTTNRRTAYDYNGVQTSASFGTATVSIPRDHRLAAWEQPFPGFSPRQDRDVILLTVVPREKTEFISDMRAGANGRDAFVFVHGYNTSFADAIQRTALLAYDLQFDGIPIAFAWPSRARLLRYSADEDAATASIHDLEEFLLLVARESGARRIHIIAHSMGNRVLLEALHSLQQRNVAPTNLSNLIIAAPDLNIIRFGQLMTDVRSLAERATLYASSRDRALRLSTWFHDYRRAGQGGQELFLLSGMDSIDVSQVDTGLVAHSYYADNTSVVSDLHELINEGKPPAKRDCLTPHQRATLPFWIFACAP